MAWSKDSSRRAELPADWDRIVRRIKKRDGGRCRWILPSGARCPREGTDVDHRFRPGDHSDSNLWLLCKRHHALKTGMEARRGKRRGSRTREPERHPCDIVVAEVPEL